MFAYVCVRERKSVLWHENRVIIHIAFETILISGVFFAIVIATATQTSSRLACIWLILV